MNPPTIGVVIPAYQVEAWLDRCLRSVLDQSVPPDEVIVIDDGSTDGTADIARSTAGVTLVQQENEGLAGARNAGTRAGAAEWIFFLDADDMFLPGAMAAFRGAIDKWPDASVINPAYESEFPDGTVVRPPDQEPMVYGRPQLGRVIRRNPLVANTLIKREVAERYPYDVRTTPSEDLDLWFRLLLDGHVIVTMGVPTTRRAVGHGDSLSARILTMRRSRYAAFRRLWRDPRLSVSERGLLLYQFTRVSLGIATARLRSGR